MKTETFWYLYVHVRVARSVLQNQTNIQSRQNTFSVATLIPLITAAIIYDNIASSTSRFIFYNNNNSNLKIISVNRLSFCRLGPVEGCGCCRHSKLKLAELCVHQCVTPPTPKNSFPSHLNQLTWKYCWQLLINFPAYFLTGHQMVMVMLNPGVLFS